MVDPHGNTSEYNYTQETNYYARSSAHTDTVYDRDAYLDSISYGWRASDIAIEGAKPAPAAKVVFTESERCITSTQAPVVTSADCGTSLASATAPYWYDVPFSEVCGTGTCTNYVMTYFSEMRLTSIATYVNAGSTTTYTPKEVDSYALTQSLPQPGDGTSPELRLDAITRTGWDGGTTGLSMPSVTFGYTQLANRVAGAASWPAMLHYRLDLIDDETGGATDVFYSSPDCNQSTTSPDLPTPSTDTRQCYQEYWTPSQSTLTSDWFEKYVVTEVEQVDMVGGSPSQVTQYIYPPNGGAWHRNDSPLIPNSQRTWDQWRGYATVKTETGTTPVTETETTYLRGMDGDSTSTTANTPGAPVTATTTDGQVVPDSDQYAGFALETQTFDQASGSVVKDEISLPWSASTATHAETATGQPTGLPAEQAWFVEPQTTIDRGTLASGKWRTTQTVKLYSATTGLLTQADSQGDISQLGGTGSTETCSTVQYATPPGSGVNKGITAVPAEDTTVAVSSGGGVGTSSCPAKTAANTLSDKRYYYDGDTTYGVIPAAGVGNLTGVQNMSGWTGTTENFTAALTTAAATTSTAAPPRRPTSAGTSRPTPTAPPPERCPPSRRPPTSPRGTGPPPPTSTSSASSRPN
ncbi:hypothetical protein GXW82_21300 [Streptacidiphilus sp. 4-A2]|nr:hypothetical protein [Streptacidiphilus sp. 4-A2]